MRKLDLPTDAVNGAGDASENEGPSQDERAPDLRSSKAQGPDVGEAGEYRPAVYERVRTLPDGSTRKFVREDR